MRPEAGVQRTVLSSDSLTTVLRVREEEEERESTRGLRGLVCRRV